MSIQTTLRLAVLASVAVLTACGGGGGGGATAFVPATAAPSTEATAPSTPPSTVTSSAAGSEELAAFELLNNERSTCGFGVLARSSPLDEAARGHANWQLLNNASGHSQTEQSQAFTGVTARNRAAAAGYEAASVVSDEYTTIVGRKSTVGYGVLAVRALLSAPYHLMGMVGASRDVGISVMSSDDAGTTSKFHPRVIAQFDLGYTATQGGSQEQPPNTLLTYPCNGITGTFSTLSNEVPNPVAGRNLAASPVGLPVYLVGDANKALTISSTLLQETVTGNTVSLLAPITSATDPNKTLKRNEAIVLPDTPLKTNTEYAVTIVGTNDNTSFTKAFKFKTGSIAQATSAPQ